MRRAIAASRADLKCFSRAARNRSPRVLNMVPAMALPRLWRRAITDSPPDTCTLYTRHAVDRHQGRVELSIENANAQAGRAGARCVATPSNPRLGCWRQPNNCCGVNLCWRASVDIVSPLSHSCASGGNQQPSLRRSRLQQNPAINFLL